MFTSGPNYVKQISAYKHSLGSSVKRLLIIYTELKDSKVSYRW